MSASIWTPDSFETPALPAIAPVSFVPGTISNPGINFVGDTDTGFWQNVTGQIKAAVNGDNIININSTGLQLANGKKLMFAVEVDVASASTCDIGVAASNSVRITGTTNITSFGTTYLGPMFVRFESVLTLTNSATLIIPGGANLTTAAGDCAIVIPKATAGVADGWYIALYQRAVGTGSFTTLTTSGSVGIGGAVSGTYRLDVQRGDSSAVARFYQSGVGLSTQVFWNNVGSANNALITRFPTGEFAITTSGTDPIDFYTNGTFRGRISGTDGHVAFGGSPQTNTQLYVASSTISNTFNEYGVYSGLTIAVPSGAFAKVAVAGFATASTGYTGTGPVIGVQGAAIASVVAAVASMVGVNGRVDTGAAATVATMACFSGTISNSGAGTIAQSQVFLAPDFANNNHVGFYSQVTSGTGKYAIYAAGSAPSWFGGDVLVFGAGGIGYTTGAGGTVTQATSKATGVTLNKSTGQITLNAANLAANTAVSFTFTNSTIAAADTVSWSIRSGATIGAYIISTDATAAGSCTVTVRNMTAGALAEAIVLNYNVIKGATA